LSSLKFSIGRLMFKCNFEVGRHESLGTDDEGREVGAAQPHPMSGGESRRRLPRALWSGTPSSVQAPHRGSEEMCLPEQIDGSHREESRRTGHRSISFWDALDPTEREALRSVASWRTFAAGARIMQEGERADHVIVILGGRTRIYVSRNGEECVLAERGVGQLVGERAALHVSVRSATVIAVELVWALVVHTKDFAAFLSAHPRALVMVQDQRYDRGTEVRAGFEYADCSSDNFGTGPVDSMATTSLTGYGLAAEPSQQQRRPLHGENCTVILTDVVEFGVRTRNDTDRRIIREALLSMTCAALKGIPDAWSEDRGDGILTVVPPSIPTGKVIDRLLKVMLAALEQHNSVQHASARFRLRLAINVGPVASDTMGVSGEAIIVVARLIEAQDFKDALTTSAANLGLIASPFVYETVIRHGSDPSDVASYSQVRVEVKESDTSAWMKLFDESVPSQMAPHSARS
jgi:hypothetical protein